MHSVKDYEINGRRNYDKLLIENTKEFIVFTTSNKECVKIVIAEEDSLLVILRVLQLQSGTDREDKTPVSAKRDNDTQNQFFMHNCTAATSN